MNQYITSDPKYVHPDTCGDRFQIIALYPGTGVSKEFLVDTWRPLDTPLNFPGFGKIKYRILQQHNNLNWDKEKELRALCQEMNVMFQFHYYLENC